MSEGDDSVGKGREVAIFAVAVAEEWGVRERRSQR